MQARASMCMQLLCNICVWYSYYRLRSLQCAANDNIVNKYIAIRNNASTCICLKRSGATSPPTNHPSGRQSRQFLISKAPYVESPGLFQGVQQAAPNYFRQILKMRLQLGSSYPFRFAYCRPGEGEKKCEKIDDLQ